MRLCGELHGEEMVYCRIQISPLLHLPAVVRRIIGSTFPLECQGGKKPLTSASLRYQFQPSLFESREIQSTHTLPPLPLSPYLLFSYFLWSIVFIQSWSQLHFVAIIAQSFSSIKAGPTPNNSSKVFSKGTWTN